MDVFFDTSVLVAASVQAHPHHVQASRVFRRVTSGEDRGFISAHSIAEAYAGLTRVPVQPRIHPVDAARIVNENILPYFELVMIEREDYLAALQQVAAAGWPGAKIYDALLLGCAAKCNAERIYTFNLADFRGLASSDQLAKICAP